jgi:hypothetical protein
MCNEITVSLLIRKIRENVYTGTLENDFEDVPGFCYLISRIFPAGF